MIIAVGSDHRGFGHKERIAALLAREGHTVVDMGCHGTASVDYPDFALSVGRAVAGGRAALGVLVCGSGIGVSIAANKVQGIRCALVTDEYSAKMTREHNDTNMLALGANVTTLERAKGIVDIWLGEPFSHGERHQRRIDKISTYEKTH